MLIKLIKDWRENKKGQTINVNDNRARLLLNEGVAAVVAEVAKKKEPVVIEAAVSVPVNVETADVKHEVGKKSAKSKI